MRQDLNEPGGKVALKFHGRRKSMHARLAEAMDYVEEKRKELLQSFAGVPADRLGRKPSDGAWSGS